MQGLYLTQESLHAYTEENGTHEIDFGDLIDHAVQQYSQSPRGQAEENGTQVTLLNYS